MYSLLFPFHRRRGLGSYIVNYTVDPPYLVDYPCGYAVEQLIGDPYPLCGHEVVGLNGSEGKNSVIGPAVAHNADGAQIGEHCKILIHVFVFSACGYLAPHYVVRFTQDIGFLLGDVADYTHCETGAGERLTHYNGFREAKLPAERPDLVLKEVVERLDDALESCDDLGREQAVVVALDDVRVTLAGFYNVGVNSALSEEVTVGYAELSASSRNT